MSSPVFIVQLASIELDKSLGTENFTGTYRTRVHTEFGLKKQRGEDERLKIKQCKKRQVGPEWLVKANRQTFALTGGKSLAILVAINFNSV